MGWKPINTAPLDGTPIYLRVVQPYRFLPYKPNSQQAKSGQLGRWQMMNEYGGWDNCPHPLGNEWCDSAECPSILEDPSHG